MPEKDFSSIEKKLDTIIKLIAQKSLEGKNQKESIIFLGQVGLDRNSISEIIGVPPQTVSVRLSEAKSEKKKPIIKEGV